MRGESSKKPGEMYPEWYNYLFAASGPQSFFFNRIMGDEKETLTSAFKRDVSNFALHLLPRGGVKMFLVN